ncbi:Lcl C-terminal domain-containing protein [Alteromonas lipolytica]|uniref:Adhesin n=1 Tax=Alteromonas lipolytica TaxID=1856405 RepID=A0A1E8F8J2_9ALTE|nr:DUF1566 domain-containing protein [Alteromonas lipolytica]OFI32234.1 adhesin [Alteromonas lipolytica]GGF82775.1 hypothetical protein GCM10011338_38810 [Alteromonas lipolytica]
MKPLISILLALTFTTSVMAQECLTNAVETTADEVFSMVTPATVLHIPTGLIWQRCAVGQTWDGTTCSGEAEQLTWQQALVYARDFDASLLEGWRVPNVKELASLTERNCVRPAINTTFFPATPSDSFWSSTPSLTDQERVWTVAFFNASHSIKEKQRAIYLRLVKTNQP